MIEEGKEILTIGHSANSTAIAASRWPPLAASRSPSTIPSASPWPPLASTEWSNKVSVTTLLWRCWQGCDLARSQTRLWPRGVTLWGHDHGCSLVVRPREVVVAVATSQRGYDHEFANCLSWWTLESPKGWKVCSAQFWVDQKTNQIDSRMNLEFVYYFFNK